MFNGHEQMLYEAFERIRKLETRLAKAEQQIQELTRPPTQEKSSPSPLAKASSAAQEKEQVLPWLR